MECLVYETNVLIFQRNLVVVIGGGKAKDSFEKTPHSPNTDIRDRLHNLSCWDGEV